MNIKILSKRRNDLLKRREVTFEIIHEKGGTPSRPEVREQLAAMLNAELEGTHIKKMETKTGSRVTVGEANVYDSAEQAKYTEQDHIVARSMPKEKTEKGE